MKLLMTVIAVLAVLLLVAPITEARAYRGVNVRASSIGASHRNYHIRPYHVYPYPSGGRYRLGHHIRSGYRYHHFSSAPHFGFRRNVYSGSSCYCNRGYRSYEKYRR